MSWNYRIVRYADEHEGDYLAIEEVHYNEAGEPSSHGRSNVSSDKLEGILWHLEKMEEAVTKPILDDEKWPQEWVPSTKVKRRQLLEQARVHLDRAQDFERDGALARAISVGLLAQQSGFVAFDRWLQRSNPEEVLGWLRELMDYKAGRLPEDEDEEGNAEAPRSSWMMEPPE